VSWITTIHDAGGSMVEGSHAREVFGPFDTRQEAEDAGEAYYNIVKVDPHAERERWWNTLQIPDGSDTPEEAGARYLKEWT
jgi:hypothetical protein